ncbi:homeobox even-skipped homolog protein 2 [Aplysia californica]|uniref:Homeobox even-skipped homolog protein 2 n=1 Tax=Aplysia californica TaxID=6500 RepID=A0ABM0ZXV1_APLCA|nr:homeobox even-skipped homolog protein 2 [Aplysia californica]
MKDKRQRMALAWPYGIADPHLYAYLAAAAASYPYSLTPPPPGLGCYPGGVSLSRGAAPPPCGFPPPALPMSPNARPTPVAPSDFLGNLTNTYLRPNVVHNFGMGAHPGSAGFPTSPHNPLLRTPSVDPAAMSLLVAHASSASSVLGAQHLGGHSPHNFLNSIDSRKLESEA